MPDRLRDMFEEAGAQWLELPILHPADPFLETAGEDVRRRLFVTEGPRGERLALRPEFTIPVCLEHIRRSNGNVGRPARYGYGGLVFRRHDDGARELMECGFEDIGTDDTSVADADLLAMAIEGLRALGQQDLSIRLGDVGLFVSLMQALSLPDPWQLRLRRSFGVANLMAESLDNLRSTQTDRDVSDNPDIIAYARANDRNGLTDYVDSLLQSHGFLSGAGRSAEEIADRLLDKQALLSARLEPATLNALVSFLDMKAPVSEAVSSLNSFCDDHKVDLGAAAERFAQRTALMCDRLSDHQIIFDASFGRPLDYYTGMVFQISQANGGPVFGGGGRYDRLLDMLGSSIPVAAVGFTLNLNVISEVGS